MQISDVQQSDLEDVWVLNEDSVPHVGRIDRGAMHWFASNADYFRIVRVNDELAGFLIGLRPGLSYESPNYRWFCENYSDFGYIDRVAVAPSARRQGIATRLYQDFAAALDDAVSVMTCEVNIRPANEPSMRYHLEHGFLQVGTLQSESGKKEVALMEMRL
jgi:predicted GNAT superfamily acetyltransferase